ncbi:hypothetical protein B0H34DRAFT_792774 [Crassisporium funariophilum]|nr:hypothetical protein B0H34DRAFT_792774 [Crassisporium funariophilum]
MTSDFHILGPLLTGALSKPPSSPDSDSYFGNAIYESPEHSDRDDSDTMNDDDGRSDTTLEDGETPEQFGHPLQRMPRTKSADHGFRYDTERDLDSLMAATSLSNSSSRSQSTASMTSFSYDAPDYDRVIDKLLDSTPDPFELSGSRNLVMFDPPEKRNLQDFVESTPPLMIKRLRRSAIELRLLLEINHSDYREDPWNAAPHILRAVERGEYVYLCMQRLHEYNQPDLTTVAQYLDFYRQILEGLSFLHEQQIGGLNCADPSSYMVDLSSAPETPALFPEDGGSQSTRLPFDRHLYPVRYYFVNFTDARRFPKKPTYPASSPSTPIGGTRSQGPCPFKKDVQECGEMIDKTLADVPQICVKFKSLIKAMTLGGFAAEDARRLFEALCRAIEAPVFESETSPRLGSVSKVPERAHTIANFASKPRRQSLEHSDRVMSR